MLKESCCVELRSFLCIAASVFDEWKYLIIFSCFNYTPNFIQIQISHQTNKILINICWNVISTQCKKQCIYVFDLYGIIAQTLIASLSLANSNRWNKKTFQVLFNSSANALKFQLTANIAKRICKKKFVRKKRKASSTFVEVFELFFFIDLSFVRVHNFFYVKTLILHLLINTLFSWFSWILL